MDEKMNEWIDTDAQATVVGYKQIHTERGRLIDGWVDGWLETGKETGSQTDSHKGVSKRSAIGHLDGIGSRIAFCH